MSPSVRILIAAAVGIATLGVGCQCERTPASGSAEIDAGAAAPVRKALAELSELKGSVTLERDGQRRPAAAKDALFANDALETASDAEVQLRFPDGRVIEVGPDARLVFGEDASGLLLEVQRGLVLSRAPAAPSPAPGGASAAGVTIRILTPFGITRIGEGQSEVAIDVGQQSAKIEVRIGTIELVSNEGGTTEEAAAGDTLSVSVGQIQFLARQGEPMVLEPIVIILREESGTAEVRKKGARGWTQVGRDGAPLAEGDAIRVKRGRSRMSLDGSTTELTIENGGEVVFEKSGRAADLEESRLELKRGGLAMKLAPDRRSRVVVSGSILESNQGGFFTVQKTRDGLQVSAVAGDLLLRRGEAGDQKISAGEVATLGRANAVKVAPQGTPELALPTRNGTRVFHNGLDRALLTWRGEAADYRVRVAEDARFESILVEGTVHAPNLTVDIPRRGSLFWEVLDATGVKVDSGSATFAPEPKLKDSGAAPQRGRRRGGEDDHLLPGQASRRDVHRRRRGGGRSLQGLGVPRFRAGQADRRARRGADADPAGGGCVDGRQLSLVGHPTVGDRRGAAGGKDEQARARLRQLGPQPRDPDTDDRRARGAPRPDLGCGPGGVEALRERARGGARREEPFRRRDHPG